MEESVLQMSGDGDAGGNEVVQVIMQEDGQILMPEGQFIQVDTDDGQAQFIQVTGENGENQLIQLTPDGQAHLVQVQEGQDGSQIIQISPDSLGSLGDQHGLTVVTMDDQQTPMELANGTHVITSEEPHIMSEEMTEERDQMETLVMTEASEEAGGVLPEQSDEQPAVTTSVDTIPAAEEEGMSHVSHMAIIEPNTTMPAEILQEDDTAHQGETETEPGQQLEGQEEPENQPTAEPQVVEDSNTVGAQPQEQTVAPTEEPQTDKTETQIEGTGGTASEGQGVEPVPAPEKKLDLDCPIPLTSDTIVVVGGKKCVLRVDPDSNHLVAYPFSPTPTPGKRGRGRPRKSRLAEGDAASSEETRNKSKDSQSLNESSEGVHKELQHSDESNEPITKAVEGISEQENSAAEGLLGLSEDGVRRSRRKRKKAQFLSDYETGAVEGEPEDEFEDEEEGKPGYGESPKRGRGRPPGVTNTVKGGPGMNSAMQTLLMNMGVIPKKRGRGRPRRNPLPQTQTGPIPAFIIPQSNGNAVMMAQVQNMDSLQRSLVKLAPKPMDLEPSSDKATTPTSIVIENADGTTTQIITTTSEQLQQEMAEGELEKTVVMVAPGAGEEEQQQEEEGAEAVTEEGGGGEEGEPVRKKLKLEPRVPDVVDSGALDDDVADPDYEPDGEPVDEEEDIVKTHVKKEKGTTGGSTGTPVTAGSGIPPAAIIQLPDNLVPLLLPKKSPMKIGLKATESELEKFKCPKCDFQAYYQRQYQEHLQTHAEGLHKCKCCNFLAIDKESLVVHFKEAHPRCFCHVCEFMAEHAYVIKRHMMRHNNDGCECNICGKKYKDQYILKMHIKMVHMPAEVLFECQVCAKKFTRKAHLKRHLRIHEPEKPFKCSHCDYRGCERSDITKHLLIHEEPKHVCEFCGKAFRHIKNKELHVKRHKGQRDYKCGVCDFYGYTFTDIRKHIERKHSDTKNILCDKCGSAFKNDMLLREHQKRQCEVLMFEQALAVVDENGDPQNGVHISGAHLTDGQQHIMVDDHHQQILVDGGHQHIMVDGQQHILVDGQQQIMVNGQQQIMVDGQQQQIMVDGQQQIMVEGGPVNITVEQVAMPGQEQLAIEQVEQQLVVEQLDNLEQHLGHEQQLTIEESVGHSMEGDVEGDITEELITEEQLTSGEPHLEMVEGVEEEEEEEEQGVEVEPSASTSGTQAKVKEGETLEEEEEVMDNIETGDVLENVEEHTENVTQHLEEEEEEGTVPLVIKTQQETAIEQEAIGEQLLIELVQ